MSSINAFRDQLTRARHVGRGLYIVSFDRAAPQAFEEMAQALGVPYLNVSSTLARQLLDIPVAARPRRISRALTGILDAQPPAVALGRLGLLHLPELQLDPVGELVRQSRSRVLLAEWGGTSEGRTLTYAASWHDEYKQWQERDFTLVRIES